MTTIEAEVMRPQEIKTQEIRILVRNWVNLNLSIWKRWGFDIDGIQRTAPGLALFRPAPSTLSRIDGDNPSFIFRGNWFYVDEKAERKIAIMSYVTYFIGLILFFVMLGAARNGNGILAALTFLLMYLILDGFMFFSLSTSCAKTRKCIFNVPIKAISKADFFPTQSILMMSWADNSDKTGLAVRLEPDIAQEITGLIEKNAGSEILVRHPLDESPSTSVKKS